MKARFFLYGPDSDLRALRTTTRERKRARREWRRHAQRIEVAMAEAAAVCRKRARNG